MDEAVLRAAGVRQEWVCEVVSGKVTVTARDCVRLIQGLKRHRGDEHSRGHLPHSSAEGYSILTVKGVIPRGNLQSDLNGLLVGCAPTYRARCLYVRCHRNLATRR